MNHKIEIGGMWDSPQWEIFEDYQISVKEHEAEPCPHCHSRNHKTVVNKNGLGGEWSYETYYYICPRVVVALNQGDCDSTGICLDCIMENYQKIYGD